MEEEELLRLLLFFCGCVFGFQYFLDFVLFSLGEGGEGRREATPFSTVVFASGLISRQHLPALRVK